DGPFRQNLWVNCHMIGSWIELDLGIISVPVKASGTQRWVGFVEAYTDTPADTLDVDYLVLVPAAEGYGKARSVGSLATAAVNGYDDFTTLAGAGALNTRVAPAGGTWATSGVATDFVGSSSPTGSALRSTVSEATPRLAILGSTNYTDSQVEIWSQYSSAFTPGVYSAASARYVAASNYLYAVWIATTPPYLDSFRIIQVVA